jgi:hypothetical protein
MYTINKKLQQGLCAEHCAAADNTDPLDTCNLSCIEVRLEEYLEEHKILAINTENQGVIVCVGTVGERGALTFMFLYYYSQRQ